MLCLASESFYKSNALGIKFPFPIKVIIFYSTDTYIKYQDRDCLSDNDIQKTALDFENCKIWCNNNTNCGGFTVYNYRCYFKNLSCKFNLVYGKDRMILIKYES